MAWFAGRRRAVPPWSIDDASTFADFLRSNSLLNYNSLGVDPAWRRHRQTARHGTAWHTAFHCMLRVAIGGHTSLHLTGPSTMASRRRGATHRMTCEGQPSPSSKLIPVGRISQVGRGCGVSHWVCDTNMTSMQHCNDAEYGEANSIAHEGRLRPTTARGIRALLSQLDVYMRPSPSHPCFPYPLVPSTPVPSSRSARPISSHASKCSS